jgi:hypothetical protein
MTELAFDCLSIAPERCAASPTLLARLRVAETTGTTVQAMMLRCQLRIDPASRAYSDEERALLSFVFGDPARWGRTLRAFPFANVCALVSSFVGSTEVELHIPVSYDLEVAAGKYFHALRGGVIPLSMFFSGTVFGATLHGMQVEPVPWHHEATYRLPVAVWRTLMDAYFPNESWVRLRRSTIDCVARYKIAHALPTWDEAVLALLAAAQAQAEALEPALVGAPVGIAAGTDRAAPAGGTPGGPAGPPPAAGRPDPARPTSGSWSRLAPDSGSVYR